MTPENCLNEMSQRGTLRFYKMAIDRDSIVEGSSHEIHIGLCVANVILLYVLFENAFVLYLSIVFFFLCLIFVL